MRYDWTGALVEEVETLIVEGYRNKCKRCVILAVRADVGFEIRVRI